ncbi:intercellular adhesion molecule 2 [Apodemus sylvaticus]|uniref:intercellular adhesion molecule 2 n=1 Tax=Apodemus sylvaticus TaxID=10129 RepID=UPI0022420CE7|nr:intercellular adhesion molecule 2 [Apodemus sylvaticus]XP_052053414.1 intercellular adhesion molecule 2 [Apodemus sylvaticus]XP_052053415.1 intercellular adhesion molecule 2 [Apodemus sylvaticus]
MSSFACWSLSLILVLFCSPGSGEKAFEVYIWSEKQVVEVTESWKVNCSTSCAAPEAGGLETSMDKIMLEEHPQGKWKQFLVSNVSNDTVFYCHFTCSGEQHMESLNISVYQPPAQVTLKLQPPRVFVGEVFTIECKVSPVKPLERLTLSLLRGRETLKNQTFGGAETVPQEATAIFNITALEKDGLNFSCQAELDLRSHGGFIIRSISESQILEVYEVIPDNQLLIIIVAVSILLFLFVTSILLCFILGQHWHRRRTGTYGVLAAWRRLPRAFRARPV